MLELEKKHLCNSNPRKSNDRLISYVDIFILQKFDPTYLKAFFSIETFATLCNEINLLKCSLLLRFYCLKFEVFLPSRLYTFLLSCMYTLELYAELQQVTEVSSLYLIWFVEFVHFHRQPSQIFSRKFLTFHFRISLTFSHFLRVQPAFQQSVMMDVLLSVASIAFSL